MRNEAIIRAARLFKDARQAVALTGAGCSTESGIPDFRGAQGLWSRFEPQEYGTLGAFRRDPAKVWTMLAELLLLVDAAPNAGHLAMAALEQQGFLQAIITQNIDRLHQKAGSRQVVEFHGSLATFHCQTCDHATAIEAVRQQPLPPACPQCRLLLKPDIVFFDEQIPAAALRETERLVSRADLLLVAGTSCAVAPASRIPAMVAQRGGTVIELNREPVLAGLAALTITSGFADAMTALLRELAAA